MGIFGKKSASIIDKITGGEIDSAELVRRVNEHNKKYAISQAETTQQQHPQTTVSASSASFPSPPTNPITKPPYTTTTAEANFEGIPADHIDVAKITLKKFVFNLMDKNDEQTVAAQGFLGAEPTPLMLAAAARWFSIVSKFPNNAEEGRLKAQPDLEKLKELVAANYKSAPYLDAMLREYPFYTLALKSEHMASSNGFSHRDISTFVADNILPLVTDLHNFLDSLKNGNTKQIIEASNYASVIKEDNLQDIPGNIIASTKHGLTAFVFEIMKDGAVKEIIRAGFKGKEPSKEMLTAAAQIFKMVSFRVTEPAYDQTMLQRDMDRLLSYIGRQTVSPPFIMMLSEYPDYAMGSGLSFMMKQRGLSVEEAKSYLETELLPEFERLSDYIHDLRAKARLL